MDDVATTVEGPAVAAPSRCPVDHAAVTSPPIVEADTTTIGSRCPVDHASMAAEADRQATPRSANDIRMRRLLRIDPNAPKVSLIDAHNAFSRSVFVSGVRCLATYIVLPLLAPILGLSGAVGPLVSIALSAVSVTAIVISARRFFGSDHPWRWVHAVIGTAIVLLLAVSFVLDVLNLVNAV